MLVELRVRPGDFRFRSVLNAVAANDLVRHGKVAKIPHLTLYGNAEVPERKWPELRKLLERVCNKHSTLPYLVDDYESKVRGTEGNVIAFRILPSPELLSFRRELVRALSKDFPSVQPWDHENNDPWFHITIGWDLSDDDLQRVWEFLSNEHSRRDGAKGQNLHIKKGRPYLPLDALRVTILDQGGRIDREYDLVRKKLFTREQALDWSEWRKTLKAYRVEKGIELKHSRLLGQLSRMRSNPKIFFISDLHLDHGNIISYTARPFCEDINEMNSVLIQNWNGTVGDNDKVYFLGDLTFGRDRKPSKYWWPKLKGQKIFVKGNHDDDSVGTIQFDKFSIRDEYEKETKCFAVAHDPNELPDDLRRWVEANRAWVIHGDKHNNNVRDYPFVEGEKRTINVSCELLDYKPVSLSYLLSLKLNKIGRIDTIGTNTSFLGGKC
ncbi:MAG TPA: 2'-5' RNA ligase family protein [Nitrososphaerales archaeon]|nr:2'-5' RNA ligase family protein [Nitrososphaerales archaeon]